MSAIPPMPVSDLERIAQAFASSRMFGVSDPSAALTLCLLAQAEGQHPASAFRDYSIVQGRPAKKAEAMLRDFIQSGGKVKWIQLDDDRVAAEFSHPSGGTVTIDWTMERAKAAGLGTKDNWRKYPRQMLRSRVVSEGVRTVCPMATSGLYVPEEVQDFELRNNVVDGGDVEIQPPAPEREKVPGITKIKGRLNAMLKAGNKCTELEAFRKLVHDNRADIKTVRDANHEYWTGDGGDWEGFGVWMERRYAELQPKDESLGFQFLASLVQGSKSTDDLSGILDEHADAIANLDGEESRRFEELYNAREAALRSPTPMTAGAFGA